MSDTTITAEERAKWKVWAQPLPTGQTCPEYVFILRLLDALEQAEAENARLTKERDWLADKCAMHCHDKDRDDILCSDDACDISSITCFGASGCDWIEAASRAVADKSEVGA